MNKKTIRVAALVVGLIALAVGAYMLTKIWLEYRKSEKTYALIQSHAYDPNETVSPEEMEPETTPIETDFLEDTRYANVLVPSIDFASLKEQNSDTVGWIYIEDTKVNYPVVQGKDNDYYLERMFTKEGNGSGTIFLDAGNQPGFVDRNNILYGHNMQNGSMFNNLMKYKEQSFFDEHPYYVFLTPEKNYVVEIFACFTLSGWGDAWELNFEDDAAFQHWLENAKAQSMIQSDVTPEFNENIMTLSTCTYEYDDARFVVMGVMHEM